jgi:hypothetical protein
VATSACTPAEQGLFTWCSNNSDAGVAVSSEPPTYYGDVKPIVDGKCVRCHQEGGIAPFSLETYDALNARRDLAWAAVRDRRMPPWLAAPCCASYSHDWSLTDEEISVFGAWVAAQGPAGDGALPPRRPTVTVGGLSRVDVSVRMAEPYTVSPPPGTTDDTRCFVIDWPIDREVYVAGANVIPGNRAVVHHLVLGVVTGDNLAEAQSRDRKAAGPGFPCSGGAGGVRWSGIIGGGLAASESPEGIGVKVPVGSKLLLNIHYSTAHLHHDTLTDLSAIELKLEDSGRPLENIAVTNPFWVVGDAMKVKAGDPDAVFYYRYRPTLFTRGKRVKIYSAHPHMHYFGSQFLLGILRKDGSQECLLAIPRWDFGWEQSYWLKTPVTLEPDDQVYVECHFDNSETNQPLVNGVPAKPRDIAWGGNNQDMCAGFLAYAEE